MKKFIVPYLLVLLLFIVVIGILIYCKRISCGMSTLDIFTYCTLFGMLGGAIHCLRGFYLHIALLKDWDSDWNTWYYIRPIISGVMGFISLVFIKAGLLVFSNDAETVITGNRVVAYYAIAFIAGYNVQNFLAKLEDVFKSLLGIEKTSPPKKNGK